MKRSGIKRKTRLKSGGPIKRKSWIKRESTKHRQQRTRIAKETSDREQYRKTHPSCQLCRKRRAIDVHEIVRRSTADASVEQRCSWLSLCRRCHRRCEDYTDMPPVRQCCLKQQCDPEGYDLQKICELRGDDAITQEGVDEWKRIPFSEKGNTDAQSGYRPHGLRDASRVESQRSHA